MLLIRCCDKCGQEGQVTVAKYVVVGKHEVLGHQPGDVFDAELSDSERHLIGSGHLALAVEKKAPPAPAAPPVPAASAVDAKAKEA